MRPQPKDEPAQKMIQMLIRTVQQAGMRGSVKSLGGRHNCIIVIVNRVMSVYIVMRDLSVERVFARGYDEDDPTDGKSFSKSYFLMKLKNPSSSVTLRYILRLLHQYVLSYLFLFEKR